MSRKVFPYYLCWDWVVIALPLFSVMFRCLKQLTLPPSPCTLSVRGVWTSSRWAGHRKCQHHLDMAETVHHEKSDWITSFHTVDTGSSVTMLQLHCRDKEHSRGRIYCIHQKGSWSYFFVFIYLLRALIEISYVWTCPVKLCAHVLLNISSMTTTCLHCYYSYYHVVAWFMWTLKIFCYQST